MSARSEWSTTSAVSLPAAASVFTRVMSCPPGARTISTLISGKRLLKALITSCSTSAELAVLLRRGDQFGRPEILCGRRNRDHAHDCKRGQLRFHGDVPPVVTLITP